MAAKKTVVNKAAAKAAEDEKAAAVKAAKASAKETEATKEENVFRADLGEALPPQVAPTATDNE